MVKDGRYKSSKKPASLLLVEGKTEEIFYKRIKSIYLKSCRVKIQDLQGLYNVNKKIIDQIVNYVLQHGNNVIRVYCCVDRESRYGHVPELNIGRVKKYVQDKRIEQVLSIYSIIATKQIESWFFYDIEGIYKYLRVPHSQRNPGIFKPPEKFGYKDLRKLFKRYDKKRYTKGKKAGNFINHLNIEQIASNCKELNKGIKLIKSQANELTNHLFSSRKRKKK